MDYICLNVDIKLQKNLSSVEFDKTRMLLLNIILIKDLSYPICTIQLLANSLW